MTRRLLAAAALAVVCTPVAASAGTFTFRDPVSGCVYTVWTPDITAGRCPPICPGIEIDGGFGQSTSCP